MLSGYLADTDSNFDCDRKYGRKRILRETERKEISLKFVHSNAQLFSLEFHNHIYIYIKYIQIHTHIIMSNKYQNSSLIYEDYIFTSGICIWDVYTHISSIFTCKNWHVKCYKNTLFKTDYDYLNTTLLTIFTSFQDENHHRLEKENQ